jgi:purine-binding chemotaxis protein CheW
MQDVSLSPDRDESQNGVDHDEVPEVQELVQLCIFELSDRLFGLSIFDVQEILENAEITPVPTTPHFLQGVINLRGDIVPVVDIREILQLPFKERTQESRIMILQINHVYLGILVDAITEVRHIEKQIVQTESTQMGVPDGKFISNIIQYKEGLLVLLDLGYLYTAIQL